MLLLPLLIRYSNIKSVHQIPNLIPTTLDFTLDGVYSIVNCKLNLSLIIIGVWQRHVPRLECLEPHRAPPGLLCNSSQCHANQNRTKYRRKQHENPTLLRNRGFKNGPRSSNLEDQTCREKVSIFSSKVQKRDPGGPILGICTVSDDPPASSPHGQLHRSGGTYRFTCPTPGIVMPNTRNCHGISRNCGELFFLRT